MKDGTVYPIPNRNLLAPGQPDFMVAEALAQAETGRFKAKRVRRRRLADIDCVQPLTTDPAEAA